ncbi:uncharacterized protein LOC127107406 [Lathyrus oleraceus]|uniref:uncharacterized protein LOC127107406 n=1 Tax=Pisum sativum TaxID=3888 RepID=UPI001FC4E8B0|nr:uncharacterized protein LOC127107406 [Pisum sativum]
MAPKIWDILSETKRIIDAQPRHYLTLTLIFLLPPSFVSLLFNFLVKYLQQQQPPPQPTYPILIISLVSILFLLISSIFTLCAIISITYSIYHSFFNQPIKLKEAFKSVSTSFFPLLATDIIIFTIFFIVILLFALVIGAVSFLIAYVAGVDLQANSFLVMVSLMLVFLTFMLYLGVHLSLVKVIVVVESVWGFEPLRRSWKLVKGRKRLILSVSSLFGSLQSMWVWLTGYNWVLILVFSPIVAMLWLYSIAVLTVLYIYCKEKNEKLADEEFGKEKDEASLPLITS